MSLSERTSTSLFVEETLVLERRSIPLLGLHRCKAEAGSPFTRKKNVRQGSVFFRFFLLTTKGIEIFEIFPYYGFRKTKTIFVLTKSTKQISKNVEDTVFALSLV